ncbi:MAG: GxxExxY protein [Calditrichaceae bacterium]|jgi:GxxExxY protein
MSLIYETESYKIIGAAQEVHRVLGPGFLEIVYKDALEIEFILRKIDYEREKNLPISYKEHPLRRGYNADFVGYNKIILEVKALSGLTGDHEAQTLNYLKATEFKLGLLINFGERSLKVKRMVL